MKNSHQEGDVNLVRALEIFMAVCESGQVTAAAAALGLTQSAVSQQLRKLETALDAPLFDRARRPLELTHSGETLRRRAFRILNEVEDLRSELRYVQSSKLPVLRISMLASIATTLTTGLYDLVSKDLKIPELKLAAGLATDHQTALHSRGTDIAITSDPHFDLTDFDVIPIMEEPFFLVLPGDYQGPTRTVAELSRHLSFVRFSADSPVGRRTDQHLQRCRIDLPRSMDADRASMVVAGVTTGNSFAVLTPSLLIDAVAEGMNLRFEPLPFTGFKRSIVAISRSGDLGDISRKVAEQSAQMLRRQFQNLLPTMAGDVIYHL